MKKQWGTRSQKGQILVEFCLVSILLFTLVVGIADLTRLYFTYSSMSNAAREGARYGIVNPADVAGIRARALQSLVTFASEPEIEVSYPDGGPVVGGRLRVRVECDFDLLVVPTRPIRLIADSTMRIETVP